MLKNINNKSKIKIKWKVNPYDYSKDGINTIISSFSKKYSIPKDRIKVEPIMISLNEKGDEIPLTSSVIQNIQDPKFQLTLFKEYLKVNNIDNYDFSLIEKIDNEINANINYKVYDKYRRYSINWIKWDNFLSYGEDNFFDFSTLKGLILLNGEPANQSGKTTFAIDLVHFLLFGKTDKSSTQDKIFNKHIPESTKVTVEGSITIDGVEYLIKRELRRTSLDKRTSASRTTQKISYFRVVLDGTLEELEEYVENENEENSKKTNKVIKEAIGNESDFDMIICATSSNLDDLIEKKDTERGRLLSRWIGLLPLEEKDILARTKFNQSIKPSLLENHYNSETLKQNIEILKLRNNTLLNDISKYNNEIKSLDKEIEELTKTNENLLMSKTLVDESVLKLDITTLNKKIETIKSNGVKKSEELTIKVNEVKEIGELSFSNDLYDEKVKENNDLNININLCRVNCNNLKKEITELVENGVCPLCKRKYDNVDNTKEIESKKKELESLINEGIKLSEKHSIIEKEIENLKINRNIFDRKNKLTVDISVIECEIEKLRSSYLECVNLKKEYENNKEAIDKNNKLDIELRNIKFRIDGFRKTKETTLMTIERHKEEVNNNNNLINDYFNLIKKMEEESILVRHWRIYQDMVGKNGVSKMVLKKTLPIINAQISNLLHDICDFVVDIDVTDKNEVMFYLIKDGVRSDLSSGSGFEKTASALALRFVLGNISTLPKNSGIILDEIWGRIAKENYDNMKRLLDKMLQSYEYIFIITHLDEVKDYCDKIVTVTKTNNISKINIIK